LGRVDEKEGGRREKKGRDLTLLLITAGCRPAEERKTMSSVMLAHASSMNLSQPNVPEGLRRIAISRTWRCSKREEGKTKG